MKIIEADGPQPSDILVVGERPGVEEHDLGRNFVGRAGEELWDRLWRICGLDRDDLRVANLVPVFSIKPPTSAEVRRYEHLLQWEIRHARPKYILTIGYHAARWFLPQFHGWTGDYFHGLAFPIVYRVGRVDRTAVLVPACHASAALREPEIYQDQFTNDLRTFARVLAGRQPLHTPRRVRPHRVGLAAFGREGQWIGLDTEGAIDSPECVTLAKGLKEVACIETHGDHRPGPFLKRSIVHSRLAIHHAKHDWQALLPLGIDLAVDCRSVDDTMLQAYLLQRPQSLKVAMYRDFGYEMSEYLDLVRPLDDQLVRDTLKGIYEKEKQKAKDQAGVGARQKARRHRRGDKQAARADRRGTDAAAAHGATGHPAHDAGAIPPRALTSINGILTKTADASPRKRWQGSKFAPLVPLPPVPSWKDLPPDVRIPYTLMDGVAHLELHQLQAPLIKRRGLNRVYHIDKGVLPWLVRNEHVGMACDKDRLVELSAEFAKDFARVCRKMSKIAGYDVSPTSWQQVSECLFDDRGVTPTRLMKDGKHFATADKYLKARKHEDILIPLVIDGRQLNKYKGTYTDKLPDMLVWDEATASWRYHPDWKYTRTATGRLAETIILLIPKHTARGLQIRDAFYATKGHRLVSCDLSQIEMRVMADRSQDEILLQVYKSGGDIHASTAYHVLGAPKKREQQDESRHRLPAKTLNFSIINGVTEYGLLDQLLEQRTVKANGEKWDIDSVREFREEWFKVHKGVKRFWNTQIGIAREKGWLADMFGRRRQISKIWSTDERIVASAERECLFGIQAAADGISKIWNKRIWRDIIQPRQRDGVYCEPWVRVHDDTTTECDRHAAQAVAAETLRAVPDLLCIPTTAEAKWGRRWGSLHKMD